MSRTAVRSWTRFFVALTVLIAVVVAAYGYLATVQDNKARGHRGDRLIRVLTADRADARADREDARQSRAQSADERAQLISQQQQLLAEVAATERRQRALLRYLKAQGIVVPPTLAAGSSSTPSRPRTSKPAATSTGVPDAPSPAPGTPTTNPPATPAPTPSPGPLSGLLGLLGDLTKGTP